MRLLSEQEPQYPKLQGNDMTTAESLLIAAIIAAIGLYAAPDLAAWWHGFNPVMVTP